MNRTQGRLFPKLLLVLLVTAALLAGCSGVDEGTLLSRVAGRALSFVQTTGGMLFASALLFLLPGGVFVAWLWRDGTWIERLILSAGLSVAVNALLVYATLSGLRLSAPVLIGFLVLCGAGIVVRWALDLRDRARAGQEAGTGLAERWASLRSDPRQLLRVGWKWLTSSEGLSLLTLAVVAVLALLVRLYVVRDFITPLWGDGYQHTVMAQLIVDHGGLFDSWEPYAPLASFTYHFGFHANVALFHWLSGEPVVKSVTWVGQIMNWLAVLVLYLLGTKVAGGRRWAGVGAVLVGGLLLPMPMYYVNWGRYTQLTGQVILVVAIWITWTLLQSSRPRAKLVPAWIAVAGLAVTHYRVLLFYLASVLVSLVLTLKRDTWRRTLLTCVWLGVGAGLLFLPWFLRILPGQTAQVFVHQVTTAASKVSAFEAQYNSIGDLTLYMPPWAWLLLILSLAWGLWRRQRGVLLLTVWWFLLLILTNPGWVFLVGTGAISNFALFIAIYIPAGALIGNMLGGWVDLVGERRVWIAALAVCLILVGAAGAVRRVDDLHAAPHSLVTHQDWEAMAWIRENTPEDAFFLVNSFPAYGDTLVVGSDAGWWMPILGGRKCSVPPLNYGAEEEPWPGYRSWVNDLTFQLQNAKLDDEATIRMLTERGITHVYIGQFEGRVNYMGPYVLDVDTLRASPRYRIIYHQDNVRVFEIVD